jgi:calcium permeable stress-gated cation channel
MLLKIFLPLSVLILPILIPLNKIGGKDNEIQNGSSNGTRWNVTGLDQLAWGNVTPAHTDRYWAHLVLAVVVIIYVCAIFFDELQGYIRLRQAYLTSPQHRLRASATTVLVRSIPRKWLSVDALDCLYDVFPGGVRNIWINRNFDELNEKVKQRNILALTLESAETELIKKCKRAQLKQAKVDAKNAGKSTKNAGNREEEDSDKRAAQMVMEPGISSGDIHQVVHTVREVLEKEKNVTERASSREGQRTRAFVPVVEGGLNAVGHGMSAVSKSVLGGLKKVERGVDGQLSRNPGFAPGYFSGAGTTAEDSLAGRHAERQEEPFGESSRAPETSKTNDGRPFWKRKSSSNSRPSIKPDTDPHGDNVPLTRLPSTDYLEEKRGKQRRGRKEWDRAEGEKYPLAYNEDIDPDCGEPLWKRYIKEKDRDTMRLPVFGLSWMPSLPLIGTKVDTIDYCRKEVARLNLEVEIDQQHPERFPLMNSAFIQFNHQVAAHMACQAVSHHVPKQMAPRSVEISPDDVIWDNMSIKWWERYLRAFGILVIVAGMVIGWAFPVAFTGLLSQLSYLEGRFTWLSWLSRLPEWVLSTMQGVLPPLFLAILMALLPLILRFLSKTQGVQTGMAIELTVQNYYFAFLFVQLFLVVSISSSFSTIVDSITKITSWPDLLAQNIPKSSNYFFSYMVLQAMSVSAGALVQIFNLISWFILAPIFDNTGRMKWARTTNLNQMQWGTFFPVYTTLASIGMHSVWPFLLHLTNFRSHLLRDCASYHGVQCPYVRSLLVRLSL